MLHQRHSTMNKTLLLLLISSLLHPISSSPTDKLDVDAICSKAPSPGKCMSTVQSSTPNLRSSDPPTVVSLLLKAAGLNANAAFTKASELRNGTNDSNLKSALKKCMYQLEKASSFVEQANKAITDSSKRDVAKSFDKLENCFRVCEDKFKENNLPSPVSEFGYMNKDLVGNSKSIFDAFWSSPTPTSFAVSSSASDKLDVNAVCAKSAYPDRCVSSVQSVADSPLTTATATEVLQLMIMATVFNTQAAVDKAKVFAKDSASDDRSKDILRNTCVRGYVRALDVLDKASKAVANGDKLGMKDNIGGLIGYYNSCEDAFKEAGLGSLMKEYDDVLGQLAENNLAVGKAFWPDAGWN